jgi:hypothetical protein
MATFIRNNSLSIVVFGLFAFAMVGQTVTGFKDNNDDRYDHGKPPLAMSEYLTSGHFIEATAENWESEFLQMAAYVVLTALLYQRGSAESKKPGGKEAVDRDPRQAKNKKDAPWPVRRGGWILRIYENSLSLTFLLLFLISFTLHAAGGAREASEEAREHGNPPVTVADYMSSSKFWFESFQNWQSEFLSLGAMAVLTIYLRQRGSPESKPVDAPHSQTGSE